MNESHSGGSRDDEAASVPDASAAERYRKIFQHSNDAVMIVDLAAERFVDVNPAACDLLGYDREELLALSPADIHPDDIGRVREEFLAEVTETGAGFTEDLTCLTKDGREVPTEVSGAALGDGGDDGRPDRMVAILRDVSERVRKERQLEAEIERLDRFAGVVSHDLRNQLEVIATRAELVAGDHDDGHGEHGEAILSAVDRIDGLLDRLLQLARTGTLAGDRSETHLDRVAHDAWALVDAPAADLRVDTALVVRAQADCLRDLLVNLFENSVAHGGPAVTVTVGTLPDRDGFYVEDDGPGVPPDDRERIFEWGHSGDDGTGFGLAIVSELAEAHGWTVSVTGSDDGGARFEFSDVDTAHRD